MQIEKSQLTMIPKKFLYVFVLILQVQCYCNALLCRTTNDHKNHTCEGATFHQIVISRPTRLELLHSEIYNCKETEIKEDAILLPNLDHLTVSCNTIKFLRSNAFKNMTHLKELNLGTNKISVWPSDVFAPLEVLQFLNLSANNIEKLTGNMFKVIPKLKILLLSHNGINEVEMDVFKNNADLEELYLNHNLIDLILVKMFNPLKKLTILDLANNQLETITAAFDFNYNLSNLNLSNNIITELPSRIFNSTHLEILDLSFNKISTVYKEVLPFKTLRELYLQNNYISIICNTPDEFKNSPLNLLDLQNNRLVFLDTDLIKTAKYLNTVKVENNPWDCICFEQMQLSLPLELGEDYRNGEEPICVNNNRKNCDVSINELEKYYKILEHYWQLR